MEEVTKTGLLSPVLKAVSLIRTFARSKPAGFGEGLGADEDLDGFGLGFLLALGEGLGEEEGDDEGVGESDDDVGVGRAAGFFAEHDAINKARDKAATKAGRKRTTHL